ncbi:hypothetical protein GPK34_02170 [Secundilactobacillus kimchicus]|uniref:Phage protein Gp138 N-terminal domain-containing protein n=1 Tax=Secundilactobacillus kimchicus JCM 15530 TaxID=1302272 RepID=A0A0R1HWF1_9LACO|nr:hypothetical protein [Secundilactobacillus kimchicus]KRK48196.1 hypothetical protein FC96_GL001935 [Secundilactobacillus kimchicus JCM 15530]MBT9670844.1 hypothetical protein [Secundilactobacillus kimchicus]
MKTGENSLVALIDSRISQSVSGLKTLFVGRVIKTKPLTVQPATMTVEGKKRTPVSDCYQLDFGFYVPGKSEGGHTRELKIGDDVLVGVIADSLEHYKKGQTLREDRNRMNSVDSSIVLGVIK